MPRSGSRAGPGGSRILELPAQCTLADAETLKMRLAELLKSVKPITVDVRGVRRIDTASMQLLAAFARDRRASELGLQMTGESGVFDEAVRLLGLAGLLGSAAGAAPHA
ncbi:MAG: STAS domain-containing protein [Steroidobacteraceae bacterium]